MQTALTMVCDRCRLRVPAEAQACPRCADEGLVRGSVWLTQERARRSGLEAQERTRAYNRRRRETRLTWVLHILGSAVMSAGVIVSNVIVNPEGWDRPTGRLLELFFLLWFCFVGPLFFFGLAFGGLVARLWSARTEARERRTREPEPGPLRVWRSERSAEGEVVRGRIRESADEPLRAPLSNRACAAFRLKGCVGSAEVDDGACHAFQVETDEGERYLVKPPAAIVLEVARVSAIAAPAEGLASFLGARGLDGGVAPVELGEALLVAGDRVEVRGVIRAEVDEDAKLGFRQAPVARVVSGQPMLPVLVSAG